MKHLKQSKFAPLLATSLLVVAGGYLATAQDESQVDVIQLRQVEVPVNRTLDLAELKEQADLVFYGEVVDLRYVMSEDGGQNQPSLPFTFITYRVDSVLKGTSPGQFATLRFIGGFDPVRGEHMRATSVPFIDLGDRDILFVQGNQTKISPLVHNEEGRLRVIDSQVYTELGHALVLGENGLVEVGARYDLEDVRTTTVLGETLSIELGKNLQTGPSNAVFVDELLGTIAGIPVTSMMPKVTFASADARLPFLSPDFTAVAPPADGGAPSNLSAEELQERASQQKPKRSSQRRPGLRRPAPQRQAQEQDDTGN